MVEDKACGNLESDDTGNIGGIKVRRTQELKSSDPLKNLSNTMTRSKIT